jgi:DNA mismatch endonuclease, patch repair protein
MQTVRTAQTDAERKVCSILSNQRRGMSLNDVTLPGSPDIAFRRKRLAVFVHGCFWHGHECPRGRLPRSRRAFWSAKIAKNVTRDRRVARALRTMGYRVVTVWSCQVRDRDRVARRLSRLLD